MGLMTFKSNFLKLISSDSKPKSPKSRIKMMKKRIENFRGSKS